MAKISRAAACIAVVAALPLTGIGASLPSDSAGAADNCAVSPGAAAPKGQHWYYRVDQVNHRKCWYLHATLPLPARAAAESPAAHPNSTASVAAPPSSDDETPQADTDSPPHSPANVSNGPGEAAGKPAPHVTVLNVKPVNAPFVGTPSASDAAMPEQTDESPTASVPDEHAKPARATRVATVQAKPDAAHDTNHPPTGGEATSSAPVPSARLLFPLLALALGIAAALIALLAKIDGVRRAPRLSEHPADTWRRYGTPDREADEAVMYPENAPFLAPQEPHGAVDLDSPQWPGRPWPARANFPPSGSRYGKLRRSEQAGLSQKDIEPRLRILRQPRRGATILSGEESGS